MSTWSRAAQLERMAPFVAGVVAFALAALSIPGAVDFPLDDAWIHLAYARSLQLGDGLSYNPGDWETGFSSPLWVALLALVPLGSWPLPGVMTLGAALHGVTAGVAAALARDLARARASAEHPMPVLAICALAGALVAVDPTLLQGATSGMEVPLAAACTALAARAALFDRPRAALLAGAASVWARPEALGFLLALAGLWVSIPRPGRPRPGSRAALLAAGGAGAAFALWSLHCLVVSGFPLPNTWYLKGGGGGVEGLRYLAEEVLPLQPWLVSLTGVVLVALALRPADATRARLLALLGAATATWLATALDRPLQVGVQFYQSRYFAPFTWAFAVGLALGLGEVRRRLLAAALLSPVALMVGLQGADRFARTRDLRADTAATHTAVARDVARRVRPGDVVGAEGAGAMRYFTPREVTVLDLVGLNDRRAAHLHFDRARKLCYFVGRRPAILAIPAPWEPLFAPPFVVRALARFDDPAYTQVLPPRPHRVEVLEVLSVTPDWQTRCARLGYGAGKVQP